MKFNVWMVFFLLVLPVFANGLCEDQFLKSFWQVVYYVIHFGYFLFTFDLCAGRERLNNKILFYVATLILLIWFGSLAIILQPGTEVAITGAIGYMLWVVFAGSFSYSLYRVSEAQVSYTLGKKYLDTWHYFYHVLCFIFLPLGIFILYPRLQREYQKEWLRNYRE